MPRAHKFCIPDHELLVAIAAGAYGEVWLARNVVGTHRAVKIVRCYCHANGAAGWSPAAPVTS